MSTTDASIRARWVVKYNARRMLLSDARAQLSAAEAGLAWARQYRRPTITNRENAVSALRRKVTLRENQVSEARKVLDRHKDTPLRERAYAEAVKSIGIMEQGGNNVGPAVEQLIREGGGLRGQAWCGWSIAAWYRRAGSKAVTWQMGAVRLWLPLTGVRRTSSPKRGNPVRFTFDHIGMFVKDLGNGYIETIEGNTGASGAVSDSATGGDGVYRKRRHKSLVRDYLDITR